MIPSFSHGHHSQQSDMISCIVGQSHEQCCHRGKVSQEIRWPTEFLPQTPNLRTMSVQGPVHHAPKSADLVTLGFPLVTGTVEVLSSLA